MARTVTGESAGVFGSYTSMVLPQIGTGVPTPAVPGSTTPVTNTSPVAATVVITGGTMTNVSVNGSTVGAGAGTYTVPAGGTISMTYTVAPTWAWFLPAVPASLVPVFNQSGQVMTVVITGGTMTNVSVNGVTAGAGAGTYTVPPGGFITMTYTVAPTWAWSFVPVFLAAKNANGTPVAQTGAG